MASVAPCHDHHSAENLRGASSHRLSRCGSGSTVSLPVTLVTLGKLGRKAFPNSCFRSEEKILFLHTWQSDGEKRTTLLEDTCLLFVYMSIKINYIYLQCYMVQGVSFYIILQIYFYVVLEPAQYEINLFYPSIPFILHSGKFLSYSLE